MADFAPALKNTLAQEGCCQQIASDPGNKQADGTISHTNFGITLGTLTAWRLHKGQPRPSDQDVVNISQDEVAAIYNAMYWAPTGGPLLNSQALATVAFDAGVVSGPANVVAMMQKLAAAAGGTAVVADGAFGPRTAAAINACAPAKILHPLIDRMGDYFSDLVVKNANVGLWLPIWRNRRDKWRQIAIG